LLLLLLLLLLPRLARCSSTLTSSAELGSWHLTAATRCKHASA
jgi:hypothetical protein